MEKEVHAVLWLQRLADLSAAQIIALWRHFGSFDAALRASHSELAKALESEPPARLLRQRGQRSFGFAFPEEELRGESVLLPISSPDYPRLLRNLHCPPPLLYVRGDPQLLSMPQLAIVGSRRHTISGGETARAFARELTYCGFTITSGLALGIDGMAHLGALDAGKTVAVLGTGVKTIYPRRHQKLADQIVAAGGVLVSEMPADTKALPAYFPQRNRIISGLSLGVLVIEAARKSGSLITARCALDQGREVFAIPGSIHSPVSHGCHQLIREGATLVENVEDIAEHLDALVAYKREEVPRLAEPALLNSGEKTLLDKVGFDPVDFDSLVSRTGMATSELTTTLMTLELKGLLEQTAGRYQRIR